MNDFNSYLNKNPGRTEDRQQKNSVAYGDTDVSALLNMLAGKYEGAGEEEIISAIVSEAEKGRKNGTLTDADIENFERTVTPLLNEKQRKKLKKVIRYLLQK